MGEIGGRPHSDDRGGIRGFTLELLRDPGKFPIGRREE
jgi:hypothetical protein